MVYMAGSFCFAQSADCKSIYVPIMQRVSKRDEGGLEADYAVGGIFEGELGQS
jgi:hypothetical protein